MSESFVPLVHKPKIYQGRPWRLNQMKKEGIPNVNMIKSKLKSAGFLILILAAAVIAVGQGLPKGPTWDKTALPAKESKLPKSPAVSHSVKAGPPGPGIGARRCG